MHTACMNWPRVVLAVVVTVSLTGCGDTAPDADAKPESEPAMLTMSSDWSFYPEAMVRGDLTLDAGCLLVGDYLPIWPSGTAWDASTEAVTFAAGSTATAVSVRLGERFRGGGGSLPDHVYRSELGPEDVEAMNQCLEKTEALGAMFAYPED